MWTPWGPGEVSCIERCPHFGNPSIVDTLGDLVKFPVQKGVLTSGVNLYLRKRFLGHSKVSLIQMCPLTLYQPMTHICVMSSHKPI